MLIENNSLLFDPSLTKRYVNVPSRDSVLPLLSRRNGYYQRLLAEYIDTRNNGGWCSFMTFTYNDKSIPSFRGVRCVDYENFRYLTNGAFSKRLSRDYGCSMRYFCVVELGEGKGSRGVGQNPHFHVIFFLRPSSPSDSRFGSLDASTFIHFCRLYWCGLDYRKCSPVNYKFGICRSGNNLGVVNSPSAFKYVIKYVTKDSLVHSRERSVYKNSYLFFRDAVLSESSACADFLKYCYSHYPSSYLSFDFWRVAMRFRFHITRYMTDFALVRTLIRSSLTYRNLFEEYLRSLALDDVALFRNRYSTKVRCSKSLGLCGIKGVFDLDKDEITISDPSFGSVKTRVCDYYYRKLFYSVSKSSNGNVRYTINDDGIALKMSRLDDSINLCREKVLSILPLVDKLDYSSSSNSIAPSSEFASDYISSDSFSCSYLSDFLRSASADDVISLVSDYAIFKTIYQYRYFSSVDGSCPTLYPFADYHRFLSCKGKEYKSLTSSCRSFMFSNYSVSYELHPYFFSCRFIFGDITRLLDFVSSNREASISASLARSEKCSSEVLSEIYY